MFWQTGEDSGAEPTMASIEADKAAGSTLPAIRSRAPAISISIVPLLGVAAAI
jgi:hypothetical protein